MRSSGVPVLRAAAEKHNTDVWRRWKEEAQGLRMQLMFLRKARAEKAQKMVMAEELSRAARSQLIEIKTRVKSCDRRSQNSVEFFSGNNLFCTQ